MTTGRINQVSLACFALPVPRALKHTAGTSQAQRLVSTAVDTLWYTVHGRSQARSDLAQVGLFYLRLP